MRSIVKKEDRFYSHAETVSEEHWLAIISNDISYDGQFFYAVKTTGIFCRPSCKSRPPRIENVTIFQTADHALTENFRPCKRCKPTGQRLPDHEWVAVVTEYIDRNYMDNLTLESLAEICHGSPYHLHRTFKRIQEITPVEYIHMIRIKKAKEYLVETDKSISDVGHLIGMHNTSYFITFFKRMTGSTPLNYRHNPKDHRSE
ncbi:AraC family transcriptional regulator [Paenibacillus glacialis]|uniref:AraC family transcriptional regulator n=1 Tax=Paenibacillus glacialis TaxID=494026 RepID=A0A162Q326_9BACL|nr:AraC family transcriptional regulator [Paenibacillus glacialis]